MPIFVATVSLYGGLNHNIFLFRELLLFSLLCFSNLSSCLYPLSFSASSYCFMDCLNTVWFDEMADSLLFMFNGIFFKIAGGWLLSLWTYRTLLLGLEYGLYNPVLRSSDMSR